MLIELPCGNVIETRSDIGISYNGGRNEPRLAQTAERIRVIKIMTDLGYQRRDIVKYTGMSKKAIDRLIYARGVRAINSTPRQKTEEPRTSDDPVVAAFWEKWDARGKVADTREGV